MVTLAWHLIPAVTFLALSGSLTNIQTSPLNLDAVNQLYLLLGLFWQSCQVLTQKGLRAEASLTVPLLTAPCSLHVWNAGEPQVLLRCCWPKRAAQAAGSTRRGLPTHLHPVCPRNRCFSQSLGAFPSASSAYSLRRNPVFDTRPSPPVPSHGPESSHPNQTRKRGLWLSHFLPFSAFFLSSSSPDHQSPGAVSLFPPSSQSLFSGSNRDQSLLLVHWDWSANDWQGCAFP